MLPAYYTCTSMFPMQIVYHTCFAKAFMYTDLCHKLESVKYSYSNTHQPLKVKTKSCRHARESL